MKKIIIIHLSVLFIYSLLINVSQQGSDRQLGVLLLTAMALAAHIIICLILGLIKSGQARKGHLLSALIVPLIGFSSCMALSNI